MRVFFISPPPKWFRKIFLELNCCLDNGRFEVCFDCFDDSPVNAMGHELAV